MKDFHFFSPPSFTISFHLLSRVFTDVFLLHQFPSPLSFTPFLFAFWPLTNCHLVFWCLQKCFPLCLNGEGGVPCFVCCLMCVGVCCDCVYTNVCVYVPVQRCVQGIEIAQNRWTSRGLFYPPESPSVCYLPYTPT